MDVEDDDGEGLELLIAFPGTAAIVLIGWDTLAR